MGLFTDSDELKACKAKCKVDDDAREASKPQEPSIFSKITAYFTPNSAPTSQPMFGGKRRRKSQRGGFEDNSSKYGSDAAPYNASGGKRKSSKKRKGRKGTRKHRK